MGQIYSFLGLTVGVIVHGLDDDERQRRLRLRHHLRHQQRVRLRLSARQHEVPAATTMVQRGHSFAIVDEVDSILIDEARTPLIISGPLDDRSELYNTDRRVHAAARPRAITSVDEKQRTVDADRSRQREDRGRCCARPACSKGDRSTTSRTSRSCITSTRRCARTCCSQRDKDYIVRDDEVVIIDEFTGRMMQGRRYSEGLHQALEAKEHVEVQPENQTLASITFQNYFRLYEKLAGMTGTALTEADEFVRHLQARRGRDPDQRAGRAHRRGRRGLSHRGREDTTPIVKPMIECRQARRSRCWSAPPRSRSPSCSPSPEARLQAIDFDRSGEALCRRAASRKRSRC